MHVFPPELSFYAEHVLAQMDKGRYQKKRDYMERKNSQNNEWNDEPGEWFLWQINQEIMSENDEQNLFWF